MCKTVGDYCALQHALTPLSFYMAYHFVAVAVASTLVIITLTGVL
ncbi:unnamed protein product [Staurois parvus]|uniref:Uncharacterized protein n=1 Tax=Staurois parvus TaxID=386267 RepID=A0ABN9AG73_9NEOB|nr:unnamed protein product [Staurois parvus]